MSNLSYHPLALLSRSITGVNRWVGQSVAWLTLAMVLMTFLIVVLRHVFNMGWIAMQESVIYMHAYVFLAGAAYTLSQNGHVRVDIFYQAAGEKSKAWIDLLGSLLLLLPTVVFIFWISWEYVADSWELLEGSREAGGLPLVYILKSGILVMAGLLVLQGVAMVIDNLLKLMGHVGHNHDD